jgi:predicted dienelactone hydrolase
VVQVKWFEIGLVLITLGILLGYASGILMIGKRMLTAISMGALIFGLHLVHEGYRMQMMLVYLLFTVSLLSFAVWAFLKRKVVMDRKPRSWKRITIGSLGTVVLATGIFIPLYMLPMIALPKPTGPHVIGTTNYHWIDESRSEMFTAAVDDYREVVVRVWYPAEPTENMKYAPYAYNDEQMEQLDNGQPLYKKVILDSIKNAKSHSYHQLPVSSDQSRYPVLLLSPGFGASNFMYTSITEELASHGYIVVAIEHPYYTDIPTLLPEGRFTEGQVDLNADPFDWDNMGEHMQLWVEDVRFVLDRLYKLNGTDRQNIITGKMDLNRIGMLGHSFGGAAVAQVMHHDSRVLAGVNMDGFPYGAIIEAGLSNPFLYIQTTDSDAFGKQELSEEIWSDPNEYPGLDSKEEYLEAAAEFTRRKNGMLKYGGTEWVVPGAGHISFSDYVLYSPLIGVRDLTLLGKINEKLVQYFDKYVKTVE